MALKAMGEPHLGAAAMACFKWHQRPEHVVGLGELTWADWRPADHPQHVHVRHPKTDAMVWLPLDDEQGRLYPEIEGPFRALAPPVVLTTGARPYLMLCTKAHSGREGEANLPEHVTLDASRHGAMTELGDSGVTEQGGMALTGHSTPQAFRLYVKRAGSNG